MHGRRIGAERWLDALELATVALAAPFLLFPAFRPAWTVAALTALLFVYLAGWLGTGRVMARTPLDLSLLVLILTIPVAVWASALPELTLPKLTGLILGFAVFRITVNGARTSRRLDAAVVCFLALGVAMSVVGLLGTQWSSKWPALAPILSRIPRLVPALPGAEGGLQPNELAGVLLFFLPVSLVASQGLGQGNGRQRWLLGIMALLLAFCFAALLVLTQSRSAWIGAVAGLAVMAGIRWRPARWLLMGTALVVAYGLYAAGPESVVQALFPPADTVAAAGIVSLQGRFEIWSRALYAIQDFPFTGTGLGTFRRVAPLLYPLFLIGSELDIGHAHNMFLQVALDLGLLGLVAYLALIIAAIWIGWRLARSRSEWGWLGLGIVGALVAFHIYGLTDAVALGAKPGVAFWMLLALAAAAANLEQATESRQHIESDGSARQMP